VRMPGNLSFLIQTNKYQLNLTCYSVFSYRKREGRGVTNFYLFSPFLFCFLFVTFQSPPPPPF
jgi:hypothetical protein